MVAKLLGVTLGPKGRNVVLQNKYGPPKIVNDGETVLKQVLSNLFNCSNIHLDNQLFNSSLLLFFFFGISQWSLYYVRLSILWISDKIVKNSPLLEVNVLE